MVNGERLDMALSERQILLGMGALALLSQGSTAQPPDDGGDDEPTETTKDVTLALRSLSTSGVNYQIRVQAEDKPTPVTSGTAGFDRGDYIRDHGDGTYSITGDTGTADPSAPGTPEHGYGDSVEYTAIMPPSPAGIVGFSATGDHTLLVNGSVVDSSNLPEYEAPDNGGAGVNPGWWVTGSPTGGAAPELGGGPSYPGRKYTREDGNFVVNTTNELVNALDRAGSGDVIFVESDIPVHQRISTGNGAYKFADVPSGVTIAGDRGVNGSKGPLIYAENGEEIHDGVFSCGSNVTIAGLRIKGDHPGSFTWFCNYSNGYNDKGVVMRGGGGRVTNCEIFQFGHTSVLDGGPSVIDHCDLHNNMQMGLGYGVQTGTRGTKIRHCSFNNNRHSVAENGSGEYTIENCWFGPNHFDHTIDLHSKGEVTFRNSTIEAVEAAGPGISNTPMSPPCSQDHKVAVICEAFHFRNGATNVTIEDSWFFFNSPSRGSDSWMYTKGNDRETIRNNAFGEAEPPASIGHPR